MGLREAKLRPERPLGTGCSSATQTPALTHVVTAALARIAGPTSVIDATQLVEAALDLGCTRAPPAGARYARLRRHGQMQGYDAKLSGPDTGCARPGVREARDLP